MQPSSRLLALVIAAAVLGLGAGAVFGDRSSPPALPDSIVIDPDDSATQAPSVRPTQTPAPSAEPVPPRVIDDDEDDGTDERGNQDDDDDDDSDDGGSDDYDEDD